MYKFYCLTYKNERRRANMEQRMQKCNIDCEFIEGVNVDEDVRIKNETFDKKTKAMWSCMFGHLKAIETFYKSNNEYAIICEDDIYLRKDINEYIPDIITDFKHFNLDILLLGYLVLSEPTKEYFGYFNPKQDPKLGCVKSPFTYSQYGWLWGTQMYMINRSYADTILKKYLYSPFFDYTILNEKTNRGLDLIDFCSDATITLQTEKRMAIYPMLAVEEGGTDGYNTIGENVDAIKFHYESYLANYDKELFV